MIGAAFAVVAGNRERLFPAFRTGSLVYGVPVGAIGAVPALAPLLLGVAGSGAVLYDVSGRTMLQRLIPDQKLTRCLGVLESVYMGSEGLGAFAAAILVTLVGPRWTFAIAGAIIPVTFFVLRRQLRAVDVGARVPADDLALLRRTSLFEPLPVAAVERLARNSVPLVVEAGTTIIREGDVGDRVYVIASGEADVSANGSHVARLGPGAHVGEIALLRDVPRTATVVAATPVRLLSLERDVFLRTMTGHEPAHAAAHSAAEGRLRELAAPSRRARKRPRTPEPQGPIRARRNSSGEDLSALRWRDPGLGGPVHALSPEPARRRDRPRDRPADERSRPAELTVWPSTRRPRRLATAPPATVAAPPSRPPRRSARPRLATRGRARLRDLTALGPVDAPRDPELPARVRPGHVDAVGRDGGDRRRDLGVPRGEGALGAPHDHPAGDRHHRRRRGRGHRARPRRLRRDRRARCWRSCSPRRACCGSSTASNGDGRCPGSSTRRSRSSSRSRVWAWRCCLRWCGSSGRTR